tara:strand:- start:609 stop:1040 length:432 start_codon:yes stop_codon:yes gene_type:complete
MIPVLLFIIFIIAMYFTIQPLFLEKVLIPDEIGNPKDISKKMRLLNLFNQIRETEFEYDMGIISNEDFDRTNNELKLEASNLLENSNEIVTDHICSKCDCAISIQDKFCSNCGINLDNKNCKNCHSKLADNDKFCSQCGFGVS